MAKSSRFKSKFPLRSIQSGAANELVQVDHLKLTKTECGYLGVLMMIDHFTKYAVAAPYKDGTAKEVIKLVTQFWIAPFGTHSH